MKRLYTCGYLVKNQYTTPSIDDLRHKRSFLAATFVAAGLAACGFRLRGTPEFSFHSLYIEAQADSAVARQLRHTLAQAGSALTLLTEPQQRTQAQAIVQLSGEQQERVAVGLNAAGQVRELQLRLRLRFRLYGQRGQEWIGDTELLQQRDVSYSESIALAKEGEEALLWRDMQADIVQQLLRRLAAVKIQQ